MRRTMLGAGLALFLAPLAGGCGHASMDAAHREMVAHQADAQRAREEGDIAKSKKEALNAQSSWLEMRKAQVDQYQEEYGEGPGVPPLPALPGATTQQQPVPSTP